MKNKKTKIIAAVLVVIIILSTIVATINSKKDNGGVQTIKSETQLYQLYNNRYRDSNFSTFVEDYLSLPLKVFIIFIGTALPIIPLLIVFLSRYTEKSIEDDVGVVPGAATELGSSLSVGVNDAVSEKTESTSSSTRTYSETNIQVENVDEADINKTDGNYIYSLSDDKVIITNVKDPQNISIESEIRPTDSYYPRDLILYKNKLVVIAESTGSSYNRNTFILIYGIEDKAKPVKLNEIEIHAPYFTTRCIDGKLMVLSSGFLRVNTDNKTNKKVIDIEYNENSNTKKIDLSKIQYLPEISTYYQTVITEYDLNTLKDAEVQSFLVNSSNAYVSLNNMYILNERYNYGNSGSISWKTALKMMVSLIWGISSYYNNDSSYGYGYNTNIYKFNFVNNTIQYQTKTEIRGKTLNQFSLDEYQGNLRIALYVRGEGSRVAVLDDNLKVIGESDYLAKDEQMYSTRFMGNRAYLVTYRVTDPLFVIDLSNPTSPKVLGKLKISGYSTYLQSYDENHLIGIGMESEETATRDSSGRVISTSSRIVGMKMALFDVTNVTDPQLISSVKIGDSRTTSSVLTNHKALLFSKEKGIIAIPVNYYQSDFSVNDSTSTSTVVSNYTYASSNYTAEGYLVYNISVEDGITPKGEVTHSYFDNTTNKRYTTRSSTRLLRGQWIDNYLFTISEDMIKVNELDEMSLIDTLYITEAAKKAGKNNEDDKKTKGPEDHIFEIYEENQNIINQNSSSGSTIIIPRIENESL